MNAHDIGHPVDPNETYPVWSSPAWSAPDWDSAPKGVPYTGPPRYDAPPQYPPPVPAPWSGAPDAVHPGYRHVDPFGYPGGYPVPATADSDSPFAVQAAGVIAFVIAGLLLASGFLVFVGSVAAAGVGDGDQDSAKLILAGLANLVSGGLLVAGGVSITSRRTRGRPLLAYGTAVCVASAILWLEAQGTGDLIWAAIFCLPLLVATGLAMARRTSQWLATAASRQLPD
jgi:hypothetical protein